MRVAIVFPLGGCLSKPDFGAPDAIGVPDQFDLDLSADGETLVTWNGNGMSMLTRDCTPP